MKIDIHSAFTDRLLSIIDEVSRKQPVGLRLMKEEDRVHVYESDDGVNWRQIAVVSLALANPVQIGLVTDVTNGFALAEFGSVLVQAQQDNPDVIHEATQIIGTEVIDGQNRGGGIRIANPDLDSCTARSGYCEYITSVYRGALKGETEVKLQITKDVQPSTKAMTAIGHETAVELSFRALSLNNSVPIMVVYAPTFKGAYEANIRYMSAEVTISFGHGKKSTYLRDYGLGDPIWIYVGNILAALNEVGLTEAEAENVRISILPVALTEYLNNNGEPSYSNQPLTTQQATIIRSGAYERSTQSRYEDNLGLFKVSDSYNQNALFRMVAATAD